MSLLVQMDYTDRVERPLVAECNDLRASAMDLIDTYEVHIRRRGLAEGTISKRIRSLRLLEREGALEHLNHEDIERFLDGRRGRGGILDPRTRVCWLSHLRCFYQWALTFDHLTVDPTARLVRPRLRRKLPRPIPEVAYQRAIAGAPTRLLHAWLVLAGNAGLRCREIATLQGEDVRHDSIRVTGKGGRDRVIPMHPVIAAIVSTWPAEGPVFVDPATGMPYRAAQVSKLIGDYFRRDALPYCAHQLRHRFASAIYEATGDLNMVAELCGHESIETTRIYAALSVERRAHAVSLIS